jgi:hypothetical protein
MDISVSSASTYLPAQSYAQQATARAYTGTENQSTALAENARSNNQALARRDQVSELSPASPEAQRAQEEAARRKDPTAEVSRSPGFSFEVQDSRQVMKVHNAKGVLIYQVPSKGQLALIETEDSAQQPGRQLRLTA